MDLLPFPLIRPSVLLLSTTLSAHFKSRPRDGLLPTLTDLLFTATNSQHPELPHAALLKELTHHLTLPRPSLTAPAYANVVCGCRPMGASVLCGADPLRKMETGNEGSLRELALSSDAAGTVSAELAYKPVVFSLQSARKLLLAIQALPDAYKKEREFLEYLLVAKHLMEEDEFHMVQAGRVKEKKTMEVERGGGGVRCTSAVGEALPSLSIFSSSLVEEKEEHHKYGDGNVSRVDARTISPPSLVPSTTRVSRSVAASTFVPPCAWWHWWEPVKTAPPATYHFDGDAVEEDEEVAEEEDREVEGRSHWNRGIKVNEADEESGQVSSARVAQRRIAKTIDIEWKDRPTFWGIVAQLRQRELVEATMQAFQLEEHELESSAMQSNVVVQQRVLSYLCSTSARIEPEYFQCPIPFLSTHALLSAAQAVALLLSQALQPSLGTSPPPSSSSSRHSLRCAVHDVTMDMVRKESSGNRYSHVPVLCRSLSTQFTPLFLLQHYLGEDTAWRWCAEAFLHLQTGRIAKAGATNTMTSGDGGNSVIVPAATSINAPTASEELLSMERTLSSAPADLLPSFSLSASFSMRCGSSTSVSGGSSSTSISFLRVGAVYSTTLLLASLTKHWPQDILPSELLSSSLSSSLVGTAGCSDYFVAPNMRMLYEMTAILFALKPEESFPIPTADKKSAVDAPERATCRHASISTSCSTMAMQERRTPSLEASSMLAGRGVTTFIPRRVQTALQPVLRQTLWYFHSQSRLHDIADFYLFSSSWLHDFSSPAAPFRSLYAFPFDWRRKKISEHEEDREERVQKDKLLPPDEEKNGTTVTSKEEDMEGEGIQTERDERVAQNSANQRDSITVKELMWVQQQCRWKGWLEHHVWLFPVLVSTSRSQLGAASGAAAAVSHPLCSFSTLGGGEGGGGAPGSFTLPPPPKPTSLSASAAAALSLETLLSGLLSAVMLWQHSNQTRSSALSGDSVPDFLSSDVGEEMKSALQQSIQLFLRILSSQYLPPLSSSISSASRRKVGMASNWTYHHVVYLVVALNTMLFPSTDHATVPKYCHSSLEMEMSTPRVHIEKVEKEEDEQERAREEQQKAVNEAERKASEGTTRQRRPLAPLSYPDMAPLLEFCQEQLLAAEGIPSRGYLSEKASTREVSSLLLYASEILQSDVAALVEELRHPLGAQKAKRRRDRHQTVSSSSLSQRALYPIYERCWKLVKSRATQGGFTSDALQLLLWKALTSTSSSCYDDPDGELVHHYYQFVYSNTDTDNASSLPPLMAISSLQTAIQQLPRRCERPMHS